jgi:hypothetical protein
LPGHDVVTVPEMGWAGREDGEIIRLANGRFDVFITADQNLQYQQNLKDSDIPIIVLAARTNRINDLRPLISSVMQALEGIESGDIVQISS